MKLVLLGGGGYSLTLQDIANQLGYEIIAVLDDKDPTHSLDSYNEYIGLEFVDFIPAFGNNELRLLWVDKLQKAGAKLATLVHPTAYVSPSATIYPGTVILPNAIVNTNVVIEKGCIVNIGAIIDHGTVLEEGVHLAPGAIVKGENRIKSCTKVESGEVVQARQWPL